MNTAQVFDKYAHQLQVAIGHYAPQAYAIAIQVKRLDCIGTLISNGVQLIIAIICATLLLVFANRARKSANWNYFNGSAVACLLLNGLAGFSSIWGISTLQYVFDKWTWIGAFYPQLALAHDLISKALGQ